MIENTDVVTGRVNPGDQKEAARAGQVFPQELFDGIIFRLHQSPPEWSPSQLLGPAPT